MITRTLFLQEELDDLLRNIARKEDKSQNVLMCELILYALKTKSLLPPGVEEACLEGVAAEAKSLKEKQSDKPRIVLAHLESWDGWALYIDGKCSGYDNGNAPAESVLDSLADAGIIEFKTTTIKEEQMGANEMPPKELK